MKRWLRQWLGSQSIRPIAGEGSLLRNSSYACRKCGEPAQVCFLESKWAGMTQSLFDYLGGGEDCGREGRTERWVDTGEILIIGRGVLVSCAGIGTKTGPKTMSD